MKHKQHFSLILLLISSEEMHYIYIYILDHFITLSLYKHIRPSQHLYRTPYNTHADICKRSAYILTNRVQHGCCSSRLWRPISRAPQLSQSRSIRSPVYSRCSIRSNCEWERANARVCIPWVCGRWRRCDAAAWRMPVRLRRLRCSR